MIRELKNEMKRFRFECVVMLKQIISKTMGWPSIFHWRKLTGKYPARYGPSEKVDFEEGYKHLQTSWGPVLIVSRLLVILIPLIGLSLETIEAFSLPFTRSGAVLVGLATFIQLVLSKPIGPLASIYRIHRKKRPGIYANTAYASGPPWIVIFNSAEKLEIDNRAWVSWGLITGTLIWAFGDLPFSVY